MKRTTDLLVICIWTVAAAIAAMAGAWSWIRIALGLPMVVLFPGYCLVAVAAPRNDDLKPVARLAISVGVSLIFFPLLDVLWNYTSVGITLSSAVLSLSGATVLLGALAWWRRTRLPESERLRLGLRVPTFLVKQSRAGKVANVLLIISVVAVLVSGSAAFFAPRVDEKFTEFYVLSSSGSVVDYPRNVRLGAEVTVTLGIKNEEGTSLAYRVEPQMGGFRVGEDWYVILPSGEKAEKTIVVSPPREGDNQRVDFLLYRGNEEEPYRSTYFWLNVKGREEEFTDFHLAGAIRAEDLYAGNTIRLDTAIANHEDRRVTYRLVLWQVERGIMTQGPTVELAPEEQWVGEVPLFLEEASSGLVVHYQLFVGSEPQPRQVIRLYLEVR